MLTEELEQAVKELIEKDLPKQIGDALRSRLDLVSSLEAQVEALELDVVRKDSDKRTLANSLAAYQDRDKRYQNLNEREAAIEAREKTADLDKLRLELSEERRKDFQSVVRDVFRNQDLLISRTANRTGSDGYTKVFTDDESEDHTKS